MSKILRQQEKISVMPQEDIVASMAQAFREELRGLLDETPKELIIDLENVTMIDSVGLGVLIATHNSLTQITGKLIILNVSKDLCGLFRTMRLDKHFTVVCRET